MNFTVVDICCFITGHYKSKGFQLQPGLGDGTNLVNGLEPTGHILLSDNPLVHPRGNLLSLFCQLNKKADLCFPTRAAPIQDTCSKCVYRSERASPYNVVIKSADCFAGVPIPTPHMLMNDHMQVNYSLCFSFPVCKTEVISIILCSQGGHED